MRPLTLFALLLGLAASAWADTPNTVDMSSAAPAPAPADGDVDIMAASSHCSNGGSYTQPAWICPPFLGLLKLCIPYPIAPPLDETPDWCWALGGELRCINSRAQACLVTYINQGTVPPTPECYKNSYYSQFYWLGTMCKYEDNN
jgi:hypothetical protein